MHISVYKLYFANMSGKDIMHVDLQRITKEYLTLFHLFSFWLLASTFPYGNWLHFASNQLLASENRRRLISIHWKSHQWQFFMYSFLSILVFFLLSPTSFLSYSLFFVFYSSMPVSSSFLQTQLPHYFVPIKHGEHFNGRNKTNQIQGKDKKWK